ncbi:ParA family protein [Paenibacillus cellulositrophicus]|uniref:ParA family protein n=1 Tax=Paenibacillus cellulositrophicus TaxID=562959 RepID=UPI00203EF7A0|nr:ParA family protein [Paenibacillus cellulositrophicus]MCM2999981.1 ParA family protein [Paenibacillus cellulositrophicus]
MTIAISVSSTIDGSSKTTVACLFAYMLSTSYKVLAIDLCSQRHLTEVFLADQTEVETICDAFVKGDILSSIRPIADNFHLIPGDKWIGAMPINLYSEGYSATEVVIALRDLLNQAKTRYDFVVIDTPSISANELFNLSLSVTAYAVMTYSSNKIKLIDEWLDKIQHVQNVFNPTLKVAGILRTRCNNIETLHKYHSHEVVRQYPEYCWNSTFPSSPLFANFDFHDIQKTRILNAFKPIYDELILRLLKNEKGA